MTTWEIGTIIISFILGLVCGGTIGMLIMALVVMSSRADEDLGLD